MKKILFLMMFILLSAIASGQVFDPLPPDRTSITYQDGIMTFTNDDEVVQYEILIERPSGLMSVPSTRNDHAGFGDSMSFERRPDISRGNGKARVFKYANTLNIPPGPLRTSMQAVVFRRISSVVPVVDVDTHIYDGIRINFSDLPLTGFPITINTLDVRITGVSGQSSLYLDPIFIADYSPTPVTQYIGGEPSSDPDSAFTSMVDITVNMTDNITTTQHETRNNGATSSKKAISTRFNQTWDPVFAWFLRVRKESPGTETLFIHAYQDGDNVSSVQVSDALNGIGWFSINVSDPMSYMDANTSLDHTYLRFYTNNQNFYSEVRLRKEVNDSDAPTITNCTISDSSLMFGENATLSCTVTDNVEVDTVNGTIDGSDQVFMKNDSVYSYVWSCDAGALGNHEWTNTQAFDVVGLGSNIDPGITWTCGSVNWSIAFSSCDISAGPIIGINRKVPFVCLFTDAEERDCVASVIGNGTVLATSPETSVIQGIGLVHAFRSKKGILHGYYEQFIMSPERVYEISVRCGTETFNKTVIPIHKGLSSVPGGLIWSRDNILTLFVFLLLGALLIGMVIMFLKYARVIR